VIQSSVAAITSTPGGYQDPSGIGGYPPQQSIGDKLAKGINKLLAKTDQIHNYGYKSKVVYIKEEIKLNNHKKITT
jgi:hypothetical protein